MPATEQTWRDQKRLHVVFGISSTVLLLSTLWMFKADHDREWKQYQRTARDIEVKMTEWRQLEFQTASIQQELDQFQAELTAAQGAPIDVKLLADFSARATKDGELTGLAADLNGASGRADQMAAMDAILANAGFRESRLLNDRKFRRADLDKAKADYGLGIRDGRSSERLASLRAIVDRVQADVDALNLAYESVSQLRIDLDALRNQITAAADAAAKALADANTQMDQLETAVRERHAGWVEGTWLGKRWLELPILDAFNSPLKIDNEWADDLEWNINFRTIRRFDRCTTCHQMMEKTLPGSAVEPAYMNERLVTVLLTPAEADADGSQEQNVAKRLFDRLGMMLAGEGLVNRGDVTISYVQDNSAAAEAAVVRQQDTARFDGDEVLLALLKADAEASPLQPDEQAREARQGLEAGDVLVTINGDPVLDSSQRVAARLMALSADNSPLTLTVRRGMPNPFTSHPRLDLFVGSLSPHGKGEFACTICHEGQGSATTFKWASHTPNTPEQRSRWLRDYGWFDNHHWIYPMHSERFIESSCLKCHHNVSELAASEKFPEPPAPKVVQGYNLIRKFGCFGCHEINGFDGPTKRIGPDLRLEPNYFAVAQQLLTEEGYDTLSAAEQQLVTSLINNPELDGVRHTLAQLLTDDAALDSAADDEAGGPRFSDDVHDRLMPLLADVDSPGIMRRAGPSLRYVKDKLAAPFLADWIRQPSHFRPSTRMPQFFGLTDHLPQHGAGDMSEQFEPLEVLAISHYLLSSSQDYEYLTVPEVVTEAADVARGEVLFQERGCLACHSHRSFGEIEAYRKPGEIVQGPDLSHLGAKFANEDGQKWLYSWIRQPSRYHPRTIMPDLFLQPITHKDMDGQITGVSDPAADIVAYLVSDGKDSWQPAEGTLSDGSRLTGQQIEQLDALALEHLEGSYYVEQARQFLEAGIPQASSGGLQGADLELVVEDGETLGPAAKLMYVGRRSIIKFGCYGCHDIPGFEDARPIGTGLADWGLKEPSKLAYEHILEYLGLGHGGHGGGGGHHASHPAEADHAADAADEEIRGSNFDDGLPEFFSQQLQSHNRIGFLYQKLREPRGYDYEKTAEKGYNERLLMPRFPFSTEEREAVMTFVLGLIAEPPRPKYIYQPDQRQQALLTGRRVLDKYNCAGCHLLTPEKWDISFGLAELDEENDNASFLPSASAPSYPFVTHEYLAEALATATVPDHRNQLQATLIGMPALGDNGLPQAYNSNPQIDDNVLADDQDIALADLTQLPFQLWEPALVGSTIYQPGTIIPAVNPELITRRQPAEGGVLARYLLPHVTAREKRTNPNAKGSESWAWVPPPLIQEGVKVQTSWLHDFLLDPYPIRPAVVLRMPRFNMSAEEATALVNYFAARDDAAYPYAYNPERDTELLARRESSYSELLANLPAPAVAKEEEVATVVEGLRMRDAMQIVTSPNYCVKCHIVGDFTPAGADRGIAPDLSRVYQRLRPDYMRRWIAKPTSILPFSSMPVNLPYKPEDAFLGGVAQDLYHGTSIDQVDALVDLLMNYDSYAKRRTTILPLVQAAAAAAPPTEPVPGTESGSTDGATNDATNDATNATQQQLNEQEPE